MFLLFCQLLRILSKTKMPVFQAPAKQDLNLRFEWNAKMVFFPPDQFQGLSFSSENFNRFDKKNSSHDLFKFQRAKLFDPDQRTPDKFGDFLLLATIYKAFGINNNVCMYLIGQFLATYFIRRYGLNYTSNFLNESLYKII